jgi:hypothetical protein
VETIANIVYFGVSLVSAVLFMLGLIRKLAEPMERLSPASGKSASVAV